MTKRALTATALDDWLAGYKGAWESRDPERAAALFTEHATYHETPFDAPKVGRNGIRDYWANVTADQQDVAVKAHVLAVAGQTGIARWSARFTSTSSGARIELDGVFVLMFDEQGLCSELREWWHVRAGS